MVGVFPVKAAMQNKRSSLGYREVTTTKTCCFGDTGTVLRGHEFHYSTIGEMPSGVDRIYDVTNFAQEGYQYRRVLGGYMHLHFGFSPDAATAFINFCRE
jgi:cobyrinic acid a,c-diamide synthase